MDFLKCHQLCIDTDPTEQSRSSKPRQLTLRNRRKQVPTYRYKPNSTEARSQEPLSLVTLLILTVFFPEMMRAKGTL